MGVTLFEESPQPLIVKQKEVRETRVERKTSLRDLRTVLNGVGDIFGVFCFRKLSYIWD